MSKKGKGEKTAKNGRWVKDPGIKLFDALNEYFEDLGFLTEETVKLKEDTGFPGMKVLESAFDGDAKNHVFTDELANKIYRITKMYGRCE